MSRTRQHSRLTWAERDVLQARERIAAARRARSSGRDEYPELAAAESASWTLVGTSHE